MIDAQVDLAEITGSETFLHVSRGELSLVLQVPGVQALPAGGPLPGLPRPRPAVRLRRRRRAAVRARRPPGIKQGMAQIELVDLAHAYRPRPRGPADFALREVSLTWEDGGAYALLGPSGCGKTTLLNIVSGLIRPTRGQVRFDGRDVTALPPEARNIAQVFQFPVVYDTMTVFANLAFPLRNSGWSAADAGKRVEEVADLLELTPELGRRARQLGPDAKQKISLGRGAGAPRRGGAAARRAAHRHRPGVKWLLRRKLKQIHQQLAISLIYVTHDQTEALTFADRVVVMSEGEVVQAGTARELYEAPAHTFVGHFIGNPGMNFLPCTLRDGQAEIEAGPGALAPRRRQPGRRRAGPTASASGPSGWR